MPLNVTQYKRGRLAVPSLMKALFVMKGLLSVAALYLCSITVNCHLSWKVVHITDDSTEVKVENCTDPQIYLQFQDAITVGFFGDIALLNATF